MYFDEALTKLEFKFKKSNQHS